MKLKIILVLLFALFIFGCIGEQKYHETKKERLLTKNEYDIDGDGIWDYMIYDFQVVKAGEKSSIHRIVTVTRVQSAIYKKFNNLTDFYIQKVDADLSDFAIEKKQDYDACIKRLGLRAGKCITPGTCINLCSLNSERCRTIAEVYPEIVGGGILNYQKKSEDVDSIAANVRTLLLQLVRDETNERKGLYLDYIFEMKNDLAELNANPIVVGMHTKLCEQENYGAEKLALAAKKIGNYEIETKSYKYNILIEIQADGKEFSEQPIAISVEDNIPFELSTDLVSSYQTVAKIKEDKKINLKWTSSSLATQTYILAYSFQTEKAPEEYLETVETPKTNITYANLMVFGLINSIFLLISEVITSYYFAAGIALGITLATVMFFYTVFSLLFVAIKSKVEGKRINEAIISKLSKTPIRWKFSLPAALIMFIVAFVLTNYLVPEPFIIKNIIDITKFDFENTNVMLIQLAGMIMVIGAVIMLYDGVENFVKIMVLDKYYGATRRAKREDYMGQVLQLKEKIKELKALIEKATAQGIEATNEQEVLLEISLQRISLLERKMTPENVIIVTESLEKIEAAIERINEKIKIIEENWSKWKEQIEKELIEKNEIKSNMLLFIQPELRGWALAKYASEQPPEEISFEKDILKRKKITPLMLLKEMTNKKMLIGGLIIKNENIIASYIEDGKSTTVSSVLLLRLRSYLYSLGKAMGTVMADSFISVGEKAVLLIAKMSGYECALFIRREKFKEFYELWKEKIKTISE